MLAASAPPTSATPIPVSAGRFLLEQRTGVNQVWGLDSVGLVRDEDAGRILVIGSHGGLHGGRPESALPVDACAALFHDAVYEVGRKDNEARSADLAAEALTRHLPGLGLEEERVRRLILLTARHGALSAAEVSPEEALFLDCDMAVLGAPWERFEAYDKGVEAEYTAHMLKPLYRVGRRRFLQGLLEHERLYLSDFFHQRLEARARENLRRALG